MSYPKKETELQKLDFQFYAFSEKLFALAKEQTEVNNQLTKVRNRIAELKEVEPTQKGNVNNDKLN